MGRQLRGVAEGISPAAARRAASARTAEPRAVDDAHRGSPDRHRKKGAATDDFDAVGSNTWSQRRPAPAEDRYLKILQSLQAKSVRSGAAGQLLDANRGAGVGQHSSARRADARGLRDTHRASELSSESDSPSEGGYNH